MNQFGIIIQETTSGSNQQYVSPFLDLNSPEIKETITDERILASQLSNMSDVYSVQVTENYKVYSLIINNVRDYIGRSGYYVIRLYAPKSINLTQFESILEKIKEKYNLYSSSNNFNAQNYDDVLSKIPTHQNTEKQVISLKSNVNCFYYFDENNTQLGTIFNTNEIHLIHKLYAFNKNKAANESIAVNSGLKPFTEIERSKEYSIINNQKILKELRINNIPVHFNSNSTELNLLCHSNDTVTYNTDYDKKISEITTNPYSIEKFFQAELHTTQNRKRESDTRSDQIGIYVIVTLFCLIIIVLVYYLIPGISEENQNDNPNQNPITHVDTTSSEVEKPVPATINTEITFLPEGNLEDSVYKTEFPKLEKYRFKFDNKKWSYKNIEGKNSYVNFYQENIDEINKIDTLDFDPSKKEQFKNKLQQISGKEIKKKADEQVKTAVKTTPKTSPKTAAPATKSESKKKTKTQSKKTKDEDDITK